MMLGLKYNGMKKLTDLVKMPKKKLLGGNGGKNKSQMRNFSTEATYGIERNRRKSSSIYSNHAEMRGLFEYMKL